MKLHAKNAKSAKEEARGDLLKEWLKTEKVLGPAYIEKPLRRAAETRNIIIRDYGFLTSSTAQTTA